MRIPPNSLHSDQGVVTMATQVEYYKAVRIGLGASQENEMLRHNFFNKAGARRCLPQKPTLDSK